MRTGLLVGFLIKYILVFLPVVLILFSSLVSGITKVKWFIAVLLIPLILREITYAIVVTQSNVAIINGPIVLGGWAPAIPLIWCLSTWGIYWYFKKSYKR